MDTRTMMLRNRLGVTLAGVVAVTLIGAAAPAHSAAPAPAISAVSPAAVPDAPTGLVQADWKRRGKTYRTNVSWAVVEQPAGQQPLTYAAEVERDGEIILELELQNAAIILRKLIKGQTYTLRVYAVNADGRSGAAEIVLQVPGRIPPDGGDGYDPGELAGPRPKITAVTPKKGVAGSFVRITGQNFENLRYVRFGGRLAGFFMDSTGTLVVTAPRGANPEQISGTVNIEVATSGGVAKAKDAFTYIARSSRSVMKYGGR